MLLAPLVIGKSTWMPLSHSQGLAREDIYFGVSTFFTIKWAMGDLPQECRFLLNRQLMFLKQEKGPSLEAV